MVHDLLEPLLQDQDVDSYVEQLTTLRLISKWWNHVLENWPWAWRLVSNSLSLQANLRHLARSAGWHIDVIIEAQPIYRLLLRHHSRYSREVHTEAVARRLLPHGHRIRSLDLHCIEMFDMSAGFEALIQKGLPSLRSVVLRGQGRAWPTADRILASSAGQLKKLHTERLAQVPAPGWDLHAPMTLVTLVLSYDQTRTRDLILLLGSCPALRLIDLTTTSWEPIPPLSDTPVVILHNLSSFKLRADILDPTPIFSVVQAPG